MCQDLKEEMEILATSGGLKQTGDITLGLCKGASPARFPFPAPGISWEAGLSLSHRTIKTHSSVRPAVNLL